MRRTLTVALLALTLLAAACGGGGGASSSAYCKELKKAADDALRTTSTSAANMQALQGAFDTALNRIAKKAPKEISDDYDVLKQYVDLRFQAVIDPSKAATLQPKINEIAAKYTTAQKAITDYNTNKCKFTSPTTAAPKASTATTAAAPTTTAKK